MKLALCLPLALLAAAARARTIDGVDIPPGMPCATELVDIEKCASARGGDNRTDGEGETPEEADPASLPAGIDKTGCMRCLEAEGRKGVPDGALPGEQQIDAAVATCTAADAACAACVPEVNALASCALEQLKTMPGWRATAEKTEAEEKTEL